jgi:hypothetical protein
MPKIQKTKQGLFVYLPKEYMQLLAWNKGDTLACYPDRSAKQTLVLQKTLDATTKEVMQGVNPVRDAPPIKIEVTAPTQPRPIQQAPTPRPVQAQPVQQPRPATPSVSISPERMRQFIQLKQQGQ